MRPSRFLLVWPLANIRHHRWMSMGSVSSVALVTLVVATLLGFVGGYERAVERDVDGMGFDLLITARGCPYEAATLMLRGGVGLRYMPDGVVERLDDEPAVAATFPTLVHPLRSDDGNMMLVRGVTPGLQAARGFELREGKWLDEGVGVVLGFEAAEFQQRHAGDAYWLPELGEAKVLGVLERTGTEVDGTILMELGAVQSAFGLRGRLTGVGVQLHPESRGQIDALHQRYNSESELQAIGTDTVVEAVRMAMDRMGGVVHLLTGVLALLGAAIVLNTTLLRTVAEHRRLFVLHAVGLSGLFIGGAAMVESLILVAVGAAVGLGAAPLIGPWSSSLLAGYLPYQPDGNLVQLDVETVAAVMAGSLLLGAMATLPALIRLRWFGDIRALRGE